MLVAMTVFPYVRGGQGLGGPFCAHLSARRLVFPGLFALAACVLVAGSRGAVALALPLLAGGAVAKSVCRRLGGLTGDVYGALCEIAETVALAVFAARW